MPVLTLTTQNKRCIMGKAGIDLFIVADNSSAAIVYPNILQSFSLLLREIFESLSEEIESLTIWSFGNIPSRTCDHILVSSFKESFISSGKGGMCNAHIALKKLVNQINTSTDRINIILLFLATDTTDSIKILSDKEKDHLQSLSKLLIKNSQTISCPDGFKGSSEYLLQDEEEARRIVEDLKGFITKDSKSQNEGTLSEETEFSAAPTLSFLNDQDDELKPPEYYQYD